MSTEERIAEMAAAFLIKAYGSPEEAAKAVEAGLATGDHGAVRAGVIHANETVQRMGRAAVADPGQFADLVHDVMNHD